MLLFICIIQNMTVENTLKERVLFYMTMSVEQYFGSARYHERRATGRKQASPGVVVRGSVRIVASVASRLHPFAGPELYPPDLTRWRALRSELNHRHEARRMQRRFRTSPESYLAALEEKLSKDRLPT
jgi:hypothetical protein